MSEVSLPNNPVVSVGNIGYGGGSPETIRNYYTRVIFEESEFLTYRDGESGRTVTPDSNSHTFYFYRLANMFSTNINVQLNDALGENPSGFVTAVSSVMPKLMFPNVDGYVDNGCDDFGDDNLKGQFNWTTGLDSENLKNKVRVKNASPKHFSTIDDNISATITGIDVGEGALCLMFNVKPVNNYTAANGIKSTWVVSATFGDITLELSDEGLFVKVVDTITKVNLSEAKSKETPPQFGQIRDGTPFVIVVYPVWNGVCVANGVQDVRNNVSVSSTYCPKIQGANMLDSNYSDPFDPDSPSAIEVTPETVNFGTEINVSVQGCKIDSVYLPLFFNSVGSWDDVFTGPKNSHDGTTEYEYTAYPIWSRNAGGSGPSESVAISGASIDDSLEYKYFQWEVSANGGFRHSAEVFGYVMHTRERTTVRIANSNGSFAGLPGAWINYITSISVSVGMNGSSGSITVDKYGAVGDNTVMPSQSVGGISLAVSGGSGSGGQIFGGLAWGVGDDVTYDGGGWTVNLIGLEKKLEDIVIVNAPFFDGYATDEVLSWLCQYAGVVKQGSIGGRMPISEDISSPVVDIKTGTSVLEALNMICEMANATFVCEQGYVKFLQLDSSGLPSSTGTISIPYDQAISLNYSPDFDDVRNEIILTSLRKVNSTSRNINTDNILPQMVVLNLHGQTKPNIPWSKALVEGVNGYLTAGQLEDIAKLRTGDVSRYEISGSTSIPGNAKIRLYNKWGPYFVSGYTHNIDLQSKTWTTDISFSGGA